MAGVINFSPRITLIYAQRCCKLSQNPKFDNFNALLHRGRRYRAVDRRSKRYLRKENELDSDKMIKRLKAMNKSFAENDRSLEEMFPFHPLIYSRQRCMITLSIQKYVVEMEAFITADSLLPDIGTPLQVLGEIHKWPTTHWYVAQKWLQILQKTGNPRVERLIATIDAEKIPRDEFCSAMGKFFYLLPVVNGEIPPLTEFKREEIRLALKPSFGYDAQLDFLLKCIMDVLMKSSSGF